MVPYEPVHGGIEAKESTAEQHCIEISSISLAVMLPFVSQRQAKVRWAQQESGRHHDEEMPGDPGCKRYVLFVGYEHSYAPDAS
jgi:hypothetical protein